MVLTGELLPDTERGLIAKAFEKNYSIVASYSVIPTSTRVSLEIQEHGEAPSTLGLGVMGGPTAPAQQPISLSHRGSQEGTHNTQPPGPHCLLTAQHAAAHAPALEVHG